MRNHTSLSAAILCLGFASLAGCSKSNERSTYTWGGERSGSLHGTAVAGRENGLSGPSSGTGSSVTGVAYPGASHHISLDELRRYVNDGSAVIVDARGQDAFGSGHVRGAINIPASQMHAYQELGLAGVNPDQMIIIYCSSMSCQSSEMMYEYFLSEGFSNVWVYRGGWKSLAGARDIIE